MTKDETQRPSVINVMKTPLIQRAIKEFILSEGNLNSLKKLPFDKNTINKKPQPLPRVPKQKEKQTANDNAVEVLIGNTIEISDLLDEVKSSQKIKESHLPQSHFPQKPASQKDFNIGRPQSSKPPKYVVPRHNNLASGDFSDHLERHHSAQSDNLGKNIRFP